MDCSKTNARLSALIYTFAGHGMTTQSHAKAKGLSCEHEVRAGFQAAAYQILQL